MLLWSADYASEWELRANARLSALLYSPNNAQTSHFKLLLSHVNMEGKIYDSREDVDHKFGIEIISLFNYQSHPAHQSHPV